MELNVHVAAGLWLSVLKKVMMETAELSTVPPIVKTVYLLRSKGCTRFGLDFLMYLLCQVKNPDEINTRHVYLLGKM